MLPICAGVKMRSARGIVSSFSLDLSTPFSQHTFHKLTRRKEGGSGEHQNAKHRIVFPIQELASDELLPTLHAAIRHMARLDHAINECKIMTMR